MGQYVDGQYIPDQSDYAQGDGNQYANNNPDQSIGVNDSTAGEQAAASNYRNDPGAFVDPASYAANPSNYFGAQSGASPMTADHGPQNIAATAEAIKAAGGTGVESDFIHGLLGGVSKLGDYLTSKDAMSNPMVLMGLMGLGNAQNHEYQKNLAETQQQYALERAQQQADIAKGIVDRNSAAITALPRNNGIINHALTRLGGAPVYDQYGRVIGQKAAAQ